MQAYIIINVYVSILVACYAERHRRSFWKYYLLSAIFGAVIMWAYLVVIIGKSKNNNY